MTIRTKAGADTVLNFKKGSTYLTTISGNGSYTYTGSDKTSLTADNFLVCIDYCTVSTTIAIVFSSTSLATKSYNPSTGVLRLSNMVKNNAGGSTPGTYTFRAKIYKV